MWYRSAAFAKLIKNLYPYEFWIEEEKKNELGKIVSSFKKIVPGQEMGIVTWGKLLRTSTLNTKNENTLLNFLSTRIKEDVEGKKVYKSVGKCEIFLANPIVGGFWVDDRFIDYGERMGVNAWKKLLNTNSTNINDHNKLRDFLNKDRIIEKDGKKIYSFNNHWLPKKLTIPFDFYVGDKLIKKDSIFNNKELTNLLITDHKKISTQDKLNTFLRNPDKFKTIDGKYTYIPDLSSRSKKLVIPFDFYVGDKLLAKGTEYSSGNLARNILNTSSITSQSELEDFLDPDKFEIIDEKYTYIPYTQFSLRLFIPFDFYIGNNYIAKGDIYNVRQLVKLLQTDSTKINTQQKLNNFLNNAEFEIIDGKYTYIPNLSSQSKKLKVPFDFYIGNDLISKNNIYTATFLTSKLRTSSINSQDKLDYFLYNIAEFKKDEKGRLIYWPKKNSLREKKIQNQLKIKKHDILIEAQKPIRITDPGHFVKVLRLDFAFIKDEKILLAIELNGQQHYGYIPFGSSRTYEDWQSNIENDIIKINYCHNNNIPLLIFHHLLSEKDFDTIIYNLNKNPHAYNQYIPQPVIDPNVANTSLEFIKRQIYSHLYPVFNDVISFEDDASKKRYIKDTLILISKLMGIYEGGIDKTDYIRSFNTNVDLTSNYNKCLAIYNSLYPDYPLDYDEKITYSDLSKTPTLQKEKLLEKQKPKENLIPSEK